MKRIIDGRRYSTETATELLHRSYGYGGDFAHYDEGLYRTKRGAYFVAGTGGPASHYAESTGQNWTSGGSGIRVLTTSEAQRRRITTQQLGFGLLVSDEVRRRER
jgi:hypothetical protein